MNNKSVLEKLSWVAGIVSAIVALMVWLWPTSAPSTTLAPSSEAVSGTQSGITNIQVSGGGTIIISNAPNPPRPSSPSSDEERQDSSLPDHGPSFDCEKATYKSEKIVCSSNELAILDLALANAYRDVVARINSANKSTLRDQQNHWLRNTREQCDDVACLRSLYEQRIIEFKNILP